MAGQLPADPDVALARLQTVDGADVVEAAAGDVRARGRVGAGHHPAAAQRNGVHLVRRVGVPHDQLAVLRGRHQVSAELGIGKRERERLIQIEMEKMANLNLPRVGAPVHGVDLGEVAAQRASGAHLNAPHRLHVGSGLDQRRITCRLACILTVGK